MIKIRFNELLVFQLQKITRGAGGVPAPLALLSEEFDVARIVRQEYPNSYELTVVTEHALAEGLVRCSPGKGVRFRGRPRGQFVLGAAQPVASLLNRCINRSGTEVRERLAGSGPARFGELDFRLERRRPGSREPAVGRAQLPDAGRPACRLPRQSDARHQLACLGRLPIRLRAAPASPRLRSGRADHRAAPCVPRRRLKCASTSPSKSSARRTVSTRSSVSCIAMAGKR